MAKGIILSSGGFKGLDQRAGSSTGIQSLPRLVNFKVNESGALEKRNGYGVVGVTEAGMPVTALWRGKSEGTLTTLAACNGGVYSLTDADLNFKFVGQTTFAPYSFIGFGGDVYCLGGDLFKYSDGALKPVEGYVPLIATSCTTKGEGTALEQPNMLSSKRRVRFNADGVSITYILPERGYKEIISVTVDGTALTADEYIAIPDMGMVELVQPPQAGINNIEVCYAMERNYLMESIITGCRFGVVFENRLFVFGNPDYPDRIYHSELADGLPSCAYFPETAYHAFEKPVTALIPCYNRLLIFFEDAACFTYAELKTDTLGGVFTSFPVYELHSSKGCIVTGLGCAYDNTPVTLCRDGLNRWVSTAIADERSADVFSERAFRFVNEVIRTPKDVLLHNRKARSELWLCTTHGTLIYNYALDCFYTYDLCSISSIYECGEELWLGLADGRVCLFTEDCFYDGDSPIHGEFETPYCSFGSPYTLKNLNGVAVGVEGKAEVDATISLVRGNVSEKQLPAARLSLPALTEKAYRRIYSRMHLKRFFSCKLIFASDADYLTVTELHLFGKQLGKGIRIS